MDSSTLIFIALAMLSAGGVFYALVYPYLSGDARAEQRQASLLTGGPTNKRVTDRNSDAAQRRKQVADSLKDLEQKGKTPKATLEQRIAQAGLTIGKSQFFMYSGVGGVLIGGLVFYISGSILYLVPGALIGGFGLPNWVLGFLKKKRVTKFIEEFPNAVDVIIRGVKAGLPLGDCMRVIASEANEPVKSEFRQIIEQTQLGLTLGEGCERLAERVPVAESNFFAIVISIQQKAGGNLSEALSNLSRVLRDRKKMKVKVKAMSSEAKASAGIIGALPFIVTGLVYVSSPRYIELLWITSTGRVVLVVCGFWMFIGIMSMRKLVNFDM
jgi:tight adherence protein B